VQAGPPSGRELSEKGVRAVGAEWVHEGGRADVAVRAGEWAAVEVAGSAGQRERAIDDPTGGCRDEGLCALRLGEQIRQLLGRAECGWVESVVLVDQGGGA
jgi:hypothetical protein